MEDRRRMIPADLFNFKLPGDGQLSPDGSAVIYAVSELSEDKDKGFISLWIKRRGKEPHRLTTGQHQDRQPRWSPDGQRLAFVSDRSGKNQIWIMNLNGGEPWQLSTKELVESPPQWSPDGRSIAFCARVFSHGEGWEPYAGAPEGDRERVIAQALEAQKGKEMNSGKDKGEASDSNERVSDVKVITRLRHRMDGIGFYGDRRSQVFVVEVPKDIPKPRDDIQPRQLTSGDFDHQDPSWSPKGDKLVLAANRSPEADWETKQDLWLVDVDNSEMALLHENKGYCYNPAWSPDGRWIAFGGDDRSYGGSTTTSLWVVPVSGDLPHSDSTAVNLTRELNRPLGCGVSSDLRYATSLPPFCWTPDSSGLYFIYGDRGAAHLGQVPVAGGDVPRIAGDEMSTISAFHVSPSGRFVIQMGDMVTPDELYLLDPVKMNGDHQISVAGEMGQTAKPERLSYCNDELLAQMDLGRPERFTFNGAEGWEVDGFLLLPPGYKEEDGEPVPLVLFIHGGPHGVYGSSFMFQTQLMASNGMAVLYTNPRGSQTYGQEFAYAVVGDWGGADFRDIMLGVDEVVDCGLADPARLGVTGWSYGGFMTCWTVTQTSRFKAAITGACVSNRHNFYGTSDIGYTFGEHHFEGTPWDDAQRLLERSAIQYVNQVETPVMIVHGENDLRCPVEQADQFFIALRKLKKDAVYVRYPGEFHGISQPGHKLDRFSRYLAWFKHHLIEAKC